ncbi:Serine protease inhibitor (serpin family) [Minicystis rosea]|nr:Serine protease inhibitor (serpin family) [Minicystis rosea]
MDVQSSPMDDVDVRHEPSTPEIFMARFLAVLAFIPVVLAACKSGIPVDESPVTTPPSAEELTALAKSNNAFAIDLYGKLRVSKGNLAFSPTSISTTLTMAWAGARGETAAEMKAALHVDTTAAEAGAAAGKLFGSYRASNADVTLRVANRLFGDKSFSFDPTYLALTRGTFGAPLHPLDFKGDADGSRTLINDWVAGQTNDRIKDLFPPGAIKPQATLVLTNAICFLGKWVTPFPKNMTRPATFHVTATESHDVPTMHVKEHFRFAAVDGLKLLEMPYKSSDLAMTIILPDARDGLEAVEKQLSPATLDRWLLDLAADEVNVSLPTFTIDPAEPMALDEPLSALGMSRMFDPGAADFTGMASPQSDRLFVSRVFHKAFVKVDEQGTEAVAATGATISLVTARAAPPPEFHADHPFLFLLRDTRSGIVLFIGRITDPAKR